MRVILTVATCLALAACAAPYAGPQVSFGGPPLISGHSPPSAMASNSAPEPVNSVPPGFEGLGNSGPNGRSPNIASATVAVPVPF